MMLRFLRYIKFFNIGDKLLICLFFIHRGNTSLRVPKKAYHYTFVVIMWAILPVKVLR